MIEKKTRISDKVLSPVKLGLLEESPNKNIFFQKKDIFQNEMKKMKQRHENPASPDPQALIDLEALVLFKDYSAGQLSMFYESEKRKDLNEAEDESDKLTENQHKILQRALEYHQAYINAINYHKLSKS